MGSGTIHLSSYENQWIRSISMPHLVPCPERCKKCRHYAYSIKASDDLFIDGDYCVHFDNEVYWDDQKVYRLENNAEKCPAFQPREEGSVYVREVLPMVVKAFWTT